jgi:hypothetical protein
VDAAGVGLLQDEGVGDMTVTIVLAEEQDDLDAVDRALLGDADVVLTRDTEAGDGLGLRVWKTRAMSKDEIRQLLRDTASLLEDT